MIPSPLDQAFLAVQDAEGATQEVKDKLEDEYYELFLNSTIYIPTWDVPEETITGELDEDVMIQPVIVDLEDEGKACIMIFDSEQRLNEWAEGKKLGIAGLLGHDVISILGSENYLLLNPLSDLGKEFSPEEIEWLKASIVDNVEG